MLEVKERAVWLVLEHQNERAPGGYLLDRGVIRLQGRDVADLGASARAACGKG
jgi:hypothetical protein